MKIIKIAGTETQYVSTEIFTSNRDEKFHNIKHGTYGKALWMLSLSLCSKTFPVILDTTLELIDDNYILKQIFGKGHQPVKDSRGNELYVVKQDNMAHHRNDVLVLWEPVFTDIVKLSYTISGKVNEIGVGYTGKSRIGKEVVIPVPMLEVIGDCTLSWIGNDIDGNTYTQVIKYNYARKIWDIGLPTRLVNKE